MDGGGTDGWVGGWVGRWIDGYTDGWVDGPTRVDGWMDGPTCVDGWISYCTMGLQLQPHNFTKVKLPCNPVRSPTPSLSVHTEVFGSLFLLTSTQLPQHQIMLSAWSVVHSLPDHPDHLFMGRFVSDCYPAITHCQKRPENYTSFAILIWIMHYFCVRGCACVCVWSHDLDARAPAEEC